MKIEYGAYTASDADAMAALLGEVFSRRDLPAYAVGLSASEFEAFVRPFLPQAAADGLTVVARLADTGEMVGALLTEDCASAMPAGMDRLSPKYDPIYDILGQLGNEYWASRPACPGESLHLFLLGVAERVAGNGVAQGLVEACLKHGTNRGFRRAVTEATNKVSQHIFRKLGFAERVRRSYADHRFDGRTVFASIADHGGPILMDRSLTAR